MIKKAAISLVIILLVIPLFINKTIIEEEEYAGDEKFEPALTGIRSVPVLIRHIDSIASLNNVSPASPAYAILAEDVISKRFYHGFSHLNLSENWIANLGQKATGIGLASKVNPDEIMEDANAACSQQALVMMEVLKAKKINYRNVAFPHHYALEAQFGNDWYFLDADMEPAMNVEQRNHNAWKGMNDSLKVFYSSKHTPFLDYRFGNSLAAGRGEVNENPAPRLKFFQSVTGIASRFLWILALAWLFYSTTKKRTPLTGRKAA